MIRYKEKTKECQLIVKVKLPSECPVSDNDLDFFARRYLRGFLKPKHVKSNTIEYVGPIAVSLYERLSRPIGKYDFFFLIEQIVDATQKLQRNAFSWDKVVWDIHHAYINETTKEVQLIYLPLEDAAPQMSVMEFLESIIYSAQPAEDRDSDYISKFVYFLKGLPRYDGTKIEAYIAREDRSIVNTIKRHTAGSSGFMTDKRKDYYDHYEQKGRDCDDDATDVLPDSDGEPTGLLQKEEEPTGLLQKDEEATGLLTDGGGDATALLSDVEATGLLNEADDEATGLLVEDHTHYPTLYRVLTQEHISVNKPVFRLGKERSYVDYFVSNNNAVSRGHADIITRGDRYFVRDLNSKNRTFINGQAIPAQCECEILDGNRLTLGNEEFIFNAQQQ